MYYFMLGAMPLPIPPSSLEIKTPSMNKTVTLINDGEINIPKEQGLREISFDFLLPTFQKYPFATYQLGAYTAATIILYLKIWKDTKYPIPFIVVRMTPTGKFLYFTSILCLIEDFTFTEDAEQYGFDTNCSINLKEYKPYGTRRIKLKQAQDGSKTASMKNERNTDNRIRKVEIKRKDGETIVSAAKREGYSLSDTCKQLGNNISDKVNRLGGKLKELKDGAMDTIDNFFDSNYLNSDNAMLGSSEPTTMEVIGEKPSMFDAMQSTSDLQMTESVGNNPLLQYDQSNGWDPIGGYKTPRGISRPTTINADGSITIMGN